MRSKSIFGLFAFAVISFGFAAIIAQNASANSHKVIICHATDSQSSPYTTNPVSKSSADEPNNRYLNGHGDHVGPVWYAGIADHSWGDIIPPFTYVKQNGSSAEFEGRNWTEAGQAIYNNGCRPVGQTKTASVIVEIEEATCESGETISSITLLNAELKNNSAGEGSAGPGSYTVKARAIDGALFGNGNKNWAQTYVLSGPLTGEECGGDGRESDITASAVCVVEDGKSKFRITLINNGEADGEATVNGVAVEVAAGATEVVTIDAGLVVRVEFDGKIILDETNETLKCEGGNGGNEAPVTPSKPITPSSTIPELPFTAGAMTPAIAVGALSILGLVVAAAGSIKSRLIAS